MDFTQMPVSQGYKYILFMIDTFTGWTQGFPTWTEKAESESQSCLTLWPHRLYSSWNSPGQNIGVGSLSLPQGIFPTQVLNPGLPHCREKKKKNCSIKSFWYLVCPGHYKVKMRHHLLLRSSKGSLKHWALLISIVPGDLSLQEK